VNVPANNYAATAPCNDILRSAPLHNLIRKLGSCDAEGGRARHAMIGRRSESGQRTLEKAGYRHINLAFVEEITCQTQEKIERKAGPKPIRCDRGVTVWPGPRQDSRDCAARPIDTPGPPDPSPQAAVPHQHPPPSRAAVALPLEAGVRYAAPASGNGAPASV
jgi:hypothetical protein